MMTPVDVPPWVRPLLRPNETPYFDPAAFNICRQELRGAWFGLSESNDGPGEYHRCVARGDAWPTCPFCEEDELHVAGMGPGTRCLRCNSEAPAYVIEHLRRFFDQHQRPLAWESPQGCSQCGKLTERARWVYAIPTCFACLAPPAALPVRTIPPGGGS